MMLAQCCSPGPANVVLLLAVAIGMWCIFVWVPSVWRAKGDGMHKALKIVVVAGLILAVAAIVRIKQQGRQTDPAAGPSTPAVSGVPAAAGLPRLVDLGADKCIPCKMMAPILEELKEQYQGRLDVVFLDVWKNPNVSQQFGIQMIPTQIFYDAAGQERFRHEGFFSKEETAIQRRSGSGLKRWQHWPQNHEARLPFPTDGGHKSL